MLKYALSILVFLCLSVSARAATFEYSFDVTVTENAIVCNYFGPKVRYASDCGNGAEASPFETLDIGETYSGLVQLRYSDATTIDSASCSIGGLNCSFMSYGTTPAPAIDDLDTTSTRINLGNAWSTISMLDLTASLFRFENDATDYAILQASVSNVALSMFATPTITGLALPTTQLISTPLPGGAWLVFAGFGAFAVMRRRQKA